MKKHNVKFCKNCHRKFIPKRSTQLFCERACAVYWHSRPENLNRKYPKICKCGRKFISLSKNRVLCNACARKHLGEVECVICKKSVLLNEVYPYKSGFACPKHSEVWRAYKFAVWKERAG